MSNQSLPKPYVYGIFNPFPTREYSTTFIPGTVHGIAGQPASGKTTALYSIAYDLLAQDPECRILFINDEPGDFSYYGLSENLDRIIPLKFQDGLPLAKICAANKCNVVMLDVQCLQFHCAEFMNSEEARGFMQHLVRLAVDAETLIFITQMEPRGGKG